MSAAEGNSGHRVFGALNQLLAPKRKWHPFTMSGTAAGNDAAVCHVDATFMISNVPRNIISTAT
jgi:hypothetical protein